MIDDRLINAVESIAESLKVIAEKLPIGFTLEMTDGFTNASEQVRDLVLADVANSDKSTSQIVQEVLSQPLSEPGSVGEIDEPAELSGVNTEALSTFEEEVEEGVC